MKRTFAIVTLLVGLCLASCGQEKAPLEQPSIAETSPPSKSGSCSRHGRTAMTRERTKQMLCD